MRGRDWMGLFLVLFLVLSGCGQPSSSPPAEEQAPAPESEQPAEAETTPAAEEGAQLEPPAAAVTEFLEAVRTGDDEKTAMMLTPLARQKTAEYELVVAPPGSDTASFDVGKVSYLDDESARVAATWTDRDEEGEMKTDQVTWMLRRIPEGWRIAGVAATVFEGEPPLLLDFEDPEDMLAKREMVSEEISRRVAQGTLAADGQENEEETIRR